MYQKFAIKIALVALSNYAAPEHLVRFLSKFTDAVTDEWVAAQSIQCVPAAICSKFYLISTLKINSY